MEKEKLKNIVIGCLILMVIILVITLVFVLFSKKEVSAIEGRVIGNGSGFVILEGEKEDYVIETTKVYPLGSILQVKDYIMMDDEMPILLKDGTILMKEEQKEQTSVSKDEENTFNDFNPSMDGLLEQEDVKGNEEMKEYLPFDEEESISNSDEVVVSYLNEVMPNQEESVIKESFNTVVDFLFYNGTINGVSLSDITMKTKLIVMKYALKLDQKIDSYFPDYKEKISSTTKHAYTGTKEKIVTLYLNTTVMICEKNQELCQTAKQDFQNMKETLGITWSFLKQLVTHGVNRFESWYQIFSGK